MTIAELITAERVQSCTGLNSKKRVLQQLSQLLAGGADDLTENDILTSLFNREKLGSTGLGQGVAIPHGRIGGLAQAVGAFVRLQDGVDYESNDGRKVDLIFGLLVPEDTTEEHLKILASLAAMFTDDEFCTRLRQASGDQLLELLSSYAPTPTA